MNILKYIQKGFTLLETLASIAILSLVVIGPLAVTVGSSSYARISKDNMIAAYLAEEGVELLQNQYDSLYILCKRNASSTEDGGYCDPAGTPEVTTGQTAWRLFKDKLSDAGGVTCYLPKDSSASYPGNALGNAHGCSFDYKDMLASSTETLMRYDAQSSYCSYLVQVATSTSRYETSDGQAGGSFVNATSTTYVCGGVASHIPSGAVVGQKQYIRTITLDQLPTFETGAGNTQYNDDIRVISSVQFKALNGTSHTVKITRFMHARP